MSDTAHTTPDTASGSPDARFGTPRATTRPTAWVGWIWFAGLLLIMVGAINLVDGFAAVFRDDIFVTGPGGGVVALDLTTWGWIHVVLGVIQVVIGAGMLVGKAWALWTGVVVAMINVIAQLFVLPAYPFWALLIIALDCVVIYAIVVHGKEVRAT